MAQDQDEARRTPRQHASGDGGKRAPNPPPSKESGAKGLLKLCFPVSGVLTLVTWLFFRYSSVTGSYPLGREETTIVFAFWLMVVALIMFAWRHYHARKET